MKQITVLVLVGLLALAGCTASGRVGGEEHGVAAGGSVRERIGVKSLAEEESGLGTRLTGGPNILLRPFFIATTLKGLGLLVFLSPLHDLVHVYSFRHAGHRNVSGLLTGFARTQPLRIDHR
jgi:hypothetical protein